jgi:hypothetical protein
MASIGENFDATTVDPSSSFPVYPAGKYLVEIVASEMQPTKSGEGQYLKLEMAILDGEFQGGKIFDRLNLVNANATAVDIARRTLSAICHAVGEMQVQDSDQLHFKPLVADVRVSQPRTDAKTGKTYDGSNEVKGYSPAGAGLAPSNAAPQPAAQAARPAPAAARPAVALAARPAPAASTAPWKRA